jgi:hypothetical protein
MEIPAQNQYRGGYMPSRLTNLLKALTWNDFPRANRPEPAPNATAHGAQIGVEIVNQGLGLDHPAGGGVHIRDSIHVDIRYRRDQSWVASWVFNRPQPYQDGLLAHEQGHYNLVALLGRDFFLALMRLKATTYPNAAAAQADLTAASTATPSKAQAVQDRYDAATQNGTNATQQARWLGFITTAFTMPLSPPQTAADGVSIKVPILAVLAQNGIVI